MKKALISMGYRNIQKNVWAKPIGYCIATFDMDSNTWRSSFQSFSDQSIHVWNSHVYNVPTENIESDFLTYLKECETNSKWRIATGSNFEFITVKEHYELLM